MGVECIAFSKWTEFPIYYTIAQVDYSTLQQLGIISYDTRNESDFYFTSG